MTGSKGRTYKPACVTGPQARSLQFLSGGDAPPEEESQVANTKSAKKAARQTLRRTAVNKSRRSEMRTYVRKVEEAIASKDPKAAAEALHDAEPKLARAAQKGIVHKNAASRKISRLTKRVKALAV